LQYVTTTKQYKIKDRLYNMEIDNKIKLRILGVWQNADELIRQLVYSLTHLIIGLHVVLTSLAAVVVFVVN